MDRMAILAQRCQLPMERIRFHARADPTLLEDIDLGILFVIAFWSGPALQAFSELTSAVQQLDPERQLPVIVCR